MSGSFESVRLKLDRARKHREDLDLLVSEFTKAEAEKITIEHDGGARLWVIEEPSEVPPEFGLFISDALHNLRSALDYLATQLVRAQNPKAGLSDVGFPIFDSLPEYVERGLPKIKRMSQRVQTAIEAAQPYHRPTPEWKTDRLLLLNLLNNSYKHSDFKLAVLSIEGGGGWALPSGLMPGSGPLEGRTVLAAWPGEDPEMQVNLSIFLDVVIAESPWADRRVCKTLAEIEQTTRETIVRIAEAGELSP